MIDATQLKAHRTAASLLGLFPDVSGAPRTLSCCLRRCQRPWNAGRQGVCSNWFRQTPAKRGITPSSNLCHWC
jgi:hypothetical protein